MLTWVVPVVPVLVVVDGVLSCLRVHAAGDLERLVCSLPGADRFDWSMGREPLGPLGGGVTWLVGVPRDIAAQADPSAAQPQR